MTATERKLDEARYFLEQLEEQFPYFDYILSAFISAARSVSWVMRHEYCKIEGWENWFNESSVTVKEKELLSTTNAWRIAIAKKEGIKTEFYFAEYLVPEEQYYPVIDKLIKELSDGDEIEMTLNIKPEKDNVEKNNDNDDTTKIIAKIKMNKDESEFSRESIKKVCEEYYLFLKNQVEMCSDLFK